MEHVLAAICRICPLCIARRKWPASAYARIMSKIESVCPFCRAYDRMARAARER
ncbi:hypothetical protein FJY63_07075 [Candidatus Sumerlaeota bacterium]|nr:hypothetical protein [Candidatus Sumerlaeota bacterium]